MRSWKFFAENSAPTKKRLHSETTEFKARFQQDNAGMMGPEEGRARKKYLS